MIDLRFGLVAEVDEKLARVRIQYADRDDSLSPWLFVGQRWAKGSQAYDLPDVGDHVGAIVDTEAEAGMVIDAVYADGDTLPASSLDKWARTFSDGGRIEYDRAAHKLTLKAVTVEIDGKLTVSGEVHASDCVAGVIKLSSHSHVAPPFGGPTTGTTPAV